MTSGGNYSNHHFGQAQGAQNVRHGTDIYTVMIKIEYRKYLINSNNTSLFSEFYYE